MKLIGVDVGGTFTDLIITDSDTQETEIHKVPTTPEDPSIGATAGIIELCARGGIDPGAVDHVFHGTTIATNAVLEDKLPRAALVTTRNFVYILEIGRQVRNHIYTLIAEKRRLLIP
ncbi:MAG: hydantoinase/oxoprolinase N-terminal domain-containing protein, partial [Alphaproteobacteria bacterium]|nr:hydantoinase/oxoprolinase N-terminal domain-containing protein [Alphaproteobacteria bacterium]